MLGLNLSSKKEHQYMLFDIGSASVGVGIAVSVDNDLKLVWTKRFEYGYQSNDDYNRYVRTMYATLLEAGMKLTSEGFKEAVKVAPMFSIKHAEVYCLVSPPWVMSSMQQQSETKEKLFQVSESSITELQNTCLKDMFNKQEIVSWQELMGTPAVLEAYPDVVRLEGYQVQTFEHRVVHELSAQFYLSVVSESVQKHIKEVLERVLPNHDIHFSSSAKIFSSRVHTNGNGRRRRAVFFEIGGEITTIGNVQQGILSNCTTVALGTNHVLKAIAPKAQSAKEARSSLDIFHKKNQSDVSFESIPEHVRGALVEWKDAVTKSIRTLSLGVTPPTDMHILVEHSWFLLYKIALELPWELPGVRKVVGVHVEQVYPKKNTDVHTDDIRLKVFASVLHNCTSKNTMCYTKHTI